MARFIIIDAIKNKVVCLNSDHITRVVFEKGKPVQTVEMYLIEGKTVDIDFPSDDQALAFIEKNFVLFND